MRHLKKPYSRGVARFIRAEKARIRRTVQDFAEQVRQIEALRGRFIVQKS